MQILKLILMALVVIPLTLSAALGQQVQGSMRCVVKSSHVTKVQDGIFNTYAGYEGGVRIGDTISLTYKNLLFEYELVFEHIGGLNVSIFPRVPFNLTLSENDTYVRQVNPSGPISAGAVIRNKFGHYITITSDGIWAFNNGLTLKLDRYYKNDWAGILVSVLGAEVHALGINCTNNNDKLEKFISGMLTFRE